MGSPWSCVWALGWSAPAAHWPSPTPRSGHCCPKSVVQKTPVTELLCQHLNLLINIHLSYLHKGHLTHSVLKLSHVTPESIQRKPYFTCVSICLSYGQVRVNLLSNHAPKDGCKREGITEVERQKTTGGLMLHLPFYRRPSCSCRIKPELWKLLKTNKWKVCSPAHLFY